MLSEDRLFPIDKDQRIIAQHILTIELAINLTYRLPKAVYNFDF